ncbi:MAG: cyanobactin biosynthesis PatC/TenC/TruC family protein [Okeania sp. SIO3I5]|uniref:cyanobactin biosynthesis PatC/TenC/TruC family protein n=1 Tax=Okeania sp. SIO3I5 TaxID=2607805 RepID=UPI0013BD6FAC|nr:cyanobactin biosynthesis PatC/TenC/TruC family protein [Okeania sp. SIO3I5]NEQ40161.1 cyanobactin biosynthesis PatC/TenC/TruC family protein [Okeania sp. SIO3I5]
MSEKKVKATSKASSTQEEKEPQTDAVTTAQPSQPTQQPEPEAEEKTILATGLEDYGRWKAMFKDHKREGNPPFPRRGRIWA